MGLIRLIILGLVVWMFLRLIRKFQAGQAEKEKSRKVIDQENMVLCQYCSVHVPEHSAIQHEQMWFCSEGHKEKYLSSDL